MYGRSLHSWQWIPWSRRIYYFWKLNNNNLHFNAKQGWFNTNFITKQLNLTLQWEIYWRWPCCPELFAICAWQWVTTSQLILFFSHSSNNIPCGEHGTWMRREFVVVMITCHHHWSFWARSLSGYRQWSIRHIFKLADFLGSVLFKMIYLK